MLENKEINILKDGTYKVQEIPDYQGYYCIATVKIENNKIIDFEWNILDRENRIFDEKYEEVFSGNNYYQKQCRENLAGIKSYERILDETQDINKVEHIKGAGWAYKKFVNIINLALKKAGQ